MAHRCCRPAALRRLLVEQPPSSGGAITNPLFFASQGIRHRKLEVILTTTIDKLGKAGETVKVAPGHFRNHLMPKLLAVPNIEKYAFLIREQRKAGQLNLRLQGVMAVLVRGITSQLYQHEELEAEKETLMAETAKEKDETSDDKVKEEKMKEYQEAANRLDKAQLVLRRFIKVDNELREHVTKEEIIAEVARQLCVNFHPDNLQLPSPLRSLGEYELPLRLPREILRPEGRLQWTLNIKI